MSKWELGQTKPDMDKLVEMSKLFNVSVDVLTNDNLSIEEPKEKVKQIKKNNNEGGRKFILYILIIIFIAALATLSYRVASSIKERNDALKEESRKEKEKQEKKQQEIEDKLIIARTNYNRSVETFNNLVESIPSNVIAKIFAFEKKEFFKLDDDKKENIKIDFSK